MAGVVTYAALNPNLFSSASSSQQNFPQTEGEIESPSLPAVTHITPDNQKQPQPGQLTLQSISPTGGPAGTRVTIVGTGIYGNEAVNTVTFTSKLAQFYPPILKVEVGKITFTIPATMPDGCYPQTQTGTCDPSGSIKTAPGVYSVTVRTQGMDSSNALTFTVK